MFAPAGQYALPSQEIMLRKGLGCLPKQHTAPNGAGFCLSSFLYKHTAPTAHKLHQAQGLVQTYCSAGADPPPRRAAMFIKKTISASFHLVPSGRYVCTRNKSHAFP